MVEFRIDVDDNELVDKLAKAAYESMHWDAVARKREAGEDADLYSLSWEAISESRRVPFRYGVREALGVWKMVGTMDGVLVFPDDF